MSNELTQITIIETEIKKDGIVLHTLLRNIVETLYCDGEYIIRISSGVIRINGKIKDRLLEEIESN